MKYSLLLMAIIFSFTLKAEQKAITDTGKTVILNDDGTWHYQGAVTAPETVKITFNKAIFKKDASQDFAVKSKKNNSAVAINTKKWLFKPSTVNQAAEYQFVLKGKDVYGMLIAEAIGMTPEGLANIALINARKAAPNAKVIKKEYRIVNGKKMIYMEMSGSMQGINFVYCGYYYADQNGSTQLVTYTSSNLVKKYSADIEQFLNGLFFR